MHPIIVPYGSKLKSEYRKGLVGHWKMNVGGIIVPDLSGYNNYGTLTNMSNPPTATSGWAGQGLRFDGIDDYVNAGAGSSLNIGTGDGSIVFWANPKFDGFGTNQSLFSKGATWNIQSHGASSTNPMTFWNGAYYDTTFNAFLANTWYHFTLVQDGSNLLWYVNGLFDSNRVADIPSSIGVLYIGNYNGASNYFSGLIDDVRIYNRALRPVEVLHSFNQQEEEWGFDDDILPSLNTPMSILQSGQVSNSYAD